MSGILKDRTEEFTSMIKEIQKKNKINNFHNHIDINTKNIKKSKFAETATEIGNYIMETTKKLERLTECI